MGIPTPTVGQRDRFLIDPVETAKSERVLRSASRWFAMVAMLFALGGSWLVQELEMPARQTAVDLTVPLKPTPVPIVVPRSSKESKPAPALEPKDVPPGSQRFKNLSGTKRSGGWAHSEYFCWWSSRISYSVRMKRRARIHWLFAKRSEHSLSRLTNVGERLARRSAF
jgi:hypothetical protein